MQKADSNGVAANKEQNAQRKRTPSCSSVGTRASGLLVGADSQSELMRDESSQSKVLDTAEEGGFQKGTQKRGQRRPQRRRAREKSLVVNNSDNSRLPQNGLQDDATGTDNESKAGVEAQGKTHPKSRSEATKSVAADNNNNTLRQNTDEIPAKEDRQDKRKQDQRHPQNRLDAKGRAASNSSGNMLSQKDLPSAEVGLQDESTEKDQRKQRRPRNRGARKKSVVADDRNDKTLPHTGGATGERKDGQGGAIKQEQKRPKSRGETRKTGDVSNDDKVPLNGASGIENGSQNETRNLGKTRPQGGSDTKNGFWMRNRGNRRLRDKMKAKENEVANNSGSTLLTKSSATGDDETQDRARKEDQRHPRSLNDATKNEEHVPVKSSDNECTFPKNNGTTREDEGRQGRTIKQDQTCQKNKSDVKKTGVLVHTKSSNTTCTLPKNSGATGKDEGRQEKTRKRDQTREENKNDGEKREEHVPGKSSDSTLTKNSRVIPKDERRLDGAEKQDQRRTENKNHVKRIQEQVPGKIRGSTLTRINNGTTSKDEGRQERTRKQDQRRPENNNDAKKTEKHVSVKSSDGTLTQNNNIARGKYEERQDGAETKSKVKVRSAVISNNALLQGNSTTGKADETQNWAGKQDRVKNGRQSKSERKKAEESVTVNSSDTTLPKTDDATGKDEGRQDGSRSRKQDTKDQQIKNGVKKSVPLNSSNNVARPPKKGTTGINENRQDGSRMPDQQHPQNRSQTMKTEESGIVNSSNPLPPKHGSTGKDDETQLQDGARRRAGCRPQNKKKQKKIVPMNQNPMPEKDGLTGKNYETQEKTTNQDQRHPENKSQGMKSVAVNSSGNTLQQNGVWGGRDGNREDEAFEREQINSHSGSETKKSNGNSRQEQRRAQNEKEFVQKRTKKKEKQTVHREDLWTKAMKDLLDKSPEEIVNGLISEHFPSLGKKQKMKDDTVIVLIRLLAKACHSESDIALEQSFTSLQSSWFLTSRLGVFLDQAMKKKSKDPQIQGLNLETVRDIVILLTEVFNRFPNSCPNSLLVKLHKVRMALLNSGKPLDKGIIFALQELTRLKKEDKFAGRKQQRGRSPRVGTVFRLVLSAIFVVVVVVVGFYSRLHFTTPFAL